MLHVLITASGRLLLPSVITTCCPKGKLKYFITFEDALRINSSHDAGELSRGQTIRLCCSSVCTVPLLEVTWFKDGDALQHSGSTLQLGPLTAMHSGNYTCVLKTSRKITSVPYAVRVKEQQEEEEVEGLISFISAQSETQQTASVDTLNRYQRPENSSKIKVSLNFSPTAALQKANHRNQQLNSERVQLSSQT